MGWVRSMGLHLISGGSEGRKPNLEELQHHHHASGHETSLDKQKGTDERTRMTTNIKRRFSAAGIPGSRRSGKGRRKVKCSTTSRVKGGPRFHIEYNQCGPIVFTAQGMGLRDRKTAKGAPPDRVGLPNSHEESKSCRAVQWELREIWKGHIREMWNQFDILALKGNLHEGAGREGGWGGLLCRDEATTGMRVQQRAAARAGWRGDSGLWARLLKGERQREVNVRAELGTVSMGHTFLVPGGKSAGRKAKSVWEQSGSAGGGITRSAKHVTVLPGKAWAHEGKGERATERTNALDEGGRGKLHIGEKTTTTATCQGISGVRQRAPP